MKTHEKIDGRSLRLARAIVEKMEAGDVQTGIERARQINPFCGILEHRERWALFRECAP